LGAASIERGGLAMDILEAEISKLLGVECHWVIGSGVKIFTDDLTAAICARQN
jgi:hypothetical protein